MCPIESTKRWLSTVVIGHNLCPFAKLPLANDRVRFSLTPAATEDALLLALQQECQLLINEDGIDTTLLIHPQALGDFEHYNQFLDIADAALAANQLEGVLQIASFHPNYQFAGTHPNAAENYSNRSPYPILHILREEQVSAAIEQHPAVPDIPSQNIQRLTAIGQTALQQQWQACFADDGEI